MKYARIVYSIEVPAASIAINERLNADATLGAVRVSPLEYGFQATVRTATTAGLHLMTFVFLIPSDSDVGATISAFRSMASFRLLIGRPSDAYAPRRT